MSASCPFQLGVWATVSILVHLILASFLISQISVNVKAELNTNPQQIAKDPRWPNRQFNVLFDNKSLNSTQRLIIDAFLDQLQHRTCLRINKLSREQVNPFIVDPKSSENNSFVYIFKSPASFSIAQAQFIGLSSFGCLKQGRQSMILTDVAFEFPRLVLGYHLLHTLGLGNLSRPDEQVRQLLGHHLPMNQKIRKQPTASLDRTLIYGPYYAYATLFRSAPEESPDREFLSAEQGVEYLSDEELIKLKELYNCTDFQSRLSSSPTTTAATSLASSPEHVTTPTTVQPMRRRGKDRGSATDEALAVAEIASSLLGDATADADGPASTSPASAASSSDRSTTTPMMRPLDFVDGDRPGPATSGLKERPMLLKLDQFHAQDPQLMRADQMKLSFLNSTNSLEQHSLDGHKLLNIADLVPNSQESSTWPSGKSEMLISFEQSHKSPSGQAASADPVASLVSGTQVLKLCSCTCQTMSPLGGPSTLTPTTAPPTTASPGSTSPTTQSTSDLPATSELPTSSTWTPTTTTNPPPVTTLPPTQTSTQPQTQMPPLTTFSPSPKPITTPTQETPEPPTQTEPAATTSESPSEITFKPTSGPSSTSKPAPLSGASCELVDWVKPSKSIYSSAKIVWDMDRANQNYFICQTMINGELVPGKTHGFSCKVSSNGQAYEMHNFKVLTKPETVSLAWVQRKKGNLGRSNQPVVGGYSKSQDSYIVSRCLVRDENNDVITLIGYVNSQGLGWFPFDDIQIECAQYDVLACVN